MYAVMPLQLLRTAGKCMLWPVGLSQLANLNSQLDLPSGIFHCEISQIWQSAKALGSENYRLTLSGEKHLACSQHHQGG